MIDEETIQKLCDLKLNAMAAAVRELLTTAPGKGMSFEEKLGLVVEREWTDRENRRLTRRLRDAKLGMSACLEDVWCENVKTESRMPFWHSVFCGKRSIRKIGMA